MSAETVETRFLMTAQNRASAVIGAMRGDLERASQSVATFRGALAALGVGATAAAFAAQAKGAIDLADELNKLSQRTGIAVESLSVLRYQSELSGVGFEELQTALRFYNQRITDAAGGNKEALATFERMGFTQKDLQAALADSEGFLRKIADRFAGYSEGAARSALSADIFGSRNEKMVVTLAQGSAGLDRARRELERFGGVMGGEFAKKAEEFNDNLTRLSTLSQAAAISLAERLVPQLNEVVKAYIQGRVEGDGFLKSLQRAFQVGTIGTDQQISDRKLSSLTEDLLRQERVVAEVRANADRPNQTARAAMERRYRAEVAELERLQREIQTTLTYRKQLDQESVAASGGTGVATPAPLPKPAGADQGEAFLDTLRKRLTALEQDEYAVLRLEAAQKKVAASAEPLIQQLQRETEFRRELEEARRRDEQSSLAEISRRQGLVNGVGDYVRALEQETLLMGLSVEERDLRIQQLKLEEAGISALSREYQAASEQIKRAIAANAGARLFSQTRTPIENVRSELDRNRNLLLSGDIDQDTFQRRVQQLHEQIHGTGEEAKKTKTAAEELGLTFVSAAENALVKWEGFSSFLKGLEQDLIRVGTRKLFTEPLTEAASGLLKGSNLADLAAKVGSFFFGGPKALGGPVAAGVSYLVGENGPELFTPRTSGAIVPNGEMGGGNTYHIHVAVPPGTSRETALQMAARTASMLQYARGYNG